MRPANEAVPEAGWAAFVAAGAAEAVVAWAVGVADGFFDGVALARAEADEVALGDGESTAGTLAEGAEVAPAATDFTSSSSLFPGSSTRARETTMSTAAADRNSHRLDTGPP
jgi:hypothetical protein